MYLVEIEVNEIPAYVLYTYFNRFANLPRSYLIDPIINTEQITRVMGKRFPRVSPLFSLSLFPFDAVTLIRYPMFLFNCHLGWSPDSGVNSGMHGIVGVEPANFRQVALFFAVPRPVFPPFFFYFYTSIARARTSNVGTLTPSSSSSRPPLPPPPSPPPAATGAFCGVGSAGCTD